MFQKLSFKIANATVNELIIQSNDKGVLKKKQKLPKGLFVQFLFNLLITNNAKTLLFETGQLKC